MFCIGICDDDEGLCGELEKMLYDYGKENKLQMNIDIWYQGESLCRFLRENKKILDVLFLDIELLTTNGIEVGRFIREEQENSNCLHFSEQQLCDGFIPCTAYRFSDQTFRQNKSWECHEQDSENFGSQKRYFRVLWQWILFQGAV
jgi:DNA-binding LytR/AlgR family response regulator